jgi:hypothetical protein
VCRLPHPGDAQNIDSGSALQSLRPDISMPKLREAHVERRQPTSLGDVLLA